MRSPLDAAEHAVPTLAHNRLVLVDGRTFAISDTNGNMRGGTEGMVHDDLRHLSHLTVTVDEAIVEVLAADAPTALSAVVAARIRHEHDGASAVLIRRRWITGGLREDLHLHNVGAEQRSWTVRLRLTADFLHVFDVKAGLTGTEQPLAPHPDGDKWVLTARDDQGCRTIVCATEGVEFDEASSTLRWTVTTAPRATAEMSVTAEPIVDGDAAGLGFRIGTTPADAVSVHRLQRRRERIPHVASTDHRLAPVLEQCVADLAALRITDESHPDRVVVAAGAPWFMTLFGRDSLITAWMSLPFEPSLASGVLLTLGDLQGTDHDEVSEEEPGRILHELRRHGGGGPFASRQRYYGTADATPLYLMLAGEATRWGALDDPTLDRLAPSIDAALGWILARLDADPEGWLRTARLSPLGLTNQGWKDSWNGITFADGSLPIGPVALVEVQGYVYAALLAAAELADRCRLAHGAGELLARAETLRARFDARFWDDRGWFVLGIDGDGRPIDALTTNPGHALWSGIAAPVHADRYLDRLAEPAMWTGWGLRTLADTMYAYDPLSYHNGSVWPHDTAICAAGAARYGRFDIVDLLFDGALEAAIRFDGRPPELFAGIDRAEAPMPITYPASCSPQAWSSASILLLVRSLLDMEPNRTRSDVEVRRTNRAALPDLAIDGLHVGGRTTTVTFGGGPTSWAGRR